jgi:hypothetical protein
MKPKLPGDRQFLELFEALAEDRQPTFRAWLAKKHDGSLETLPAPLFGRSADIESLFIIGDQASTT